MALKLYPFEISSMLYGAVMMLANLEFSITTKYESGEILCVNYLPLSLLD